MINEMVAYYKKAYPPGTRILLHHMGNDPRPIPDGMTGTVDHVDDIGTLHCKFDNDRYLGVIPGEDSFSVIAPDETQDENMNISM